MAVPLVSLEASWASEGERVLLVKADGRATGSGGDCMPMPQIEVLLYCEDDGSAPLVDWLTSLHAEARDRCLARLALLHERGHELRRPHAENLGDGLHELRVKFFRVNYRMLYFFHGRAAAVVSHGFSKEREIPLGEIELALERMRKFERDPGRHTFQPDA